MLVWIGNNQSWSPGLELSPVVRLWVSQLLVPLLLHLSKDGWLDSFLRHDNIADDSMPHSLTDN